MRTTTIMIVVAATNKLLFISGFSVFSGFSGLSIPELPLTHPTPALARAEKRQKPPPTTPRPFVLAPRALSSSRRTCPPHQDRTRCQPAPRCNRGPFPIPTPPDTGDSFVGRRRHHTRAPAHSPD